MNATARASLANALRAEWVKLRSLRSTWWILTSLVVVGLGVTTLTVISAGNEYPNASADDQTAFDPTNVSLTTFIVAQLIVGVLGILIVTSEFASGVIQPSLMAAPRRHRLLAAKVILAAVSTLVAGQLLMLGSFLAGQVILRAQNVPSARLFDPEALAAVLGGGVYLAAIGLLAVALGALLRATAGALAALVGIVLLVPALGGVFPGWLGALLDFWPSQGAAAVLATIPDPAYPYPWLNLGGMCLGVAAVLAGAFVGFARRDV